MPLRKNREEQFDFEEEHSAKKKRNYEIFYLSSGAEDPQNFHYLSQENLSLC